MTTPKLMTLSEALRAGYSLEHANCGPSPSGAVIRVAKWDDALNCLQYIDVRPDEPPAKPPTGVYAIKASPEFTGKITLPDQTCQTCKHWEKSMGYPRHHCANIAVIDMLDADSWAAFETPADFGCTLWSSK